MVVGADAGALSARRDGAPWKSLTKCFRLFCAGRLFLGKLRRTFKLWRLIWARLTHRLGTGMLTKKKPRRAPEHLAFVRSLGCCVPGCTSRGPVHAHHVRTAANSGIGVKPDDYETVPLCHVHHDELHRNGARTFAAKHRVDLAAFAKALATKSGGVLLL